MTSEELHDRKKALEKEILSASGDCTLLLLEWLMTFGKMQEIWMAQGGADDSERIVWAMCFNTFQEATIRDVRSKNLFDNKPKEG